MAGTIQPYSPLPDNQRDELLLPVVGGLKELIFGSPGLFLDRPGFIADAVPDTALGQAVQDISRLNCRIWASRDKANYSQVVNQANADLCGPYLDSLGERPFDGAFGSPIEGGQCPTLYNVNISYTIVLGFCENVQTFAEVFASGVQGPLQVFTDNVGTTGGTANLCAGFSYTVIRLVNALGQVSQRGSGFGVRLNNISVTRADGLPDNCGNPPPLIQPPAIVTPVTPIPPSIDIDLPGFGPVTVNVDINNTGDLVIEAPDIGVEVTIEPDGEGGGGDGGDPGDPTDPGSPGSPEGTGAGGGADGEAPPGSELVGLLVTVTDAPGDANKFDNNSSQPFRGIGYVRMGYPGRLGLDISGGTVISPQFFHAPQRGLTNWSVAANIGFDLTVVPYYRSIES